MIPELNVVHQSECRPGFRLLNGTMQAAHQALHFSPLHISLILLLTLLGFAWSEVSSPQDLIVGPFAHTHLSPTETPRNLVANLLLPGSPKHCVETPLARVPNAVPNALCCTRRQRALSKASTFKTSGQNALASTV